ncbi:hypothetical protein [Methylobacterium platani]|uniref:Uncharacterized protein n=2 Tax=Methylobacterium platani TaxID=427683 RepID=A0A179S6N0_9HYPH|nr:hypothetical protein [Methylobacterium platani]KMO22397.1 hypothetical protein SQ03_00505 [Methylobacterium platani JCM 14648]OAS22480.1 hypothetical protein A5481_18975 [Methylobacterium platani]
MTGREKAAADAALANLPTGGMRLVPHPFSSQIVSAPAATVTLQVDWGASTPPSFDLADLARGWVTTLGEVLAERREQA